MIDKSYDRVKATALKQLANSANNFGDIAHDALTSSHSEREIMRATRVALHRLAAYHQFGAPYVRLTASLLRGLADKIEQADD